MIDHVAIVGGGFSGTLQAINLLRHEGPRATLIERRARAGLGLAYGAAHPDHLLNVRAGNMSAFPDDPGHFVRWLEARGVRDAGTAFAPRLVYGEYLGEQLAVACARGGERLRCVTAEVTDVAAGTDGGAAVRLADGTVIAADAAVLAVGNLPPHTPAGIDPGALGHAYRADPWGGGLAAGLNAEDTVLVLGTGLTMVDVALALDADGFAGRIVALSRRGLTPQVHAAGPANPAPIVERPDAPLSTLVARIRRRGEAIGWRNAIDELRPFTQDMWANADAGTRQRFLTHARAWWDVHRHRLAPAVAGRLEAMIAAGRLEVAAGKLVGTRIADDVDGGDGGGGVTVRWRPRGGDAVRSLRAARIVNCTGPQGDLTRTDDPLLARLAARGTLRPDPQRLGIHVDAQGRTIAQDGRTNDWLLALGPMTRGAFWEIVAVPDIRAQTWAVARRLSNAHWVGGEGL